MSGCAHLQWSFGGLGWPPTRAVAAQRTETDAIPVVRARPKDNSVSAGYLKWI